MATQSIHEIKQKASYIPYERLKILSKVLLERESKDGVTRAFSGEVQQIRKSSSNLTIITLLVEEYWENRVSKPHKVKAVDFMCNKNITLWLISTVASDDFAKTVADRRKAYAQNRNSLKFARTAEEEHFEFLHMSTSVTLEEFKIAKKKIMLKWHPDRFHASGLSQKEFDLQSGRYLDALNFVENYLTRKYNRLNLK